MSGIKQHPELSGLKVTAKQKYKRNSPRNQDPVAECKANKSSQIASDNLRWDFVSFIVLNEIYERADWLAEMEELGEGRPHKAIIHGQIAERLRMIKQLEKRKEEQPVQLPSMKKTK